MPKSVATPVQGRQTAFSLTTHGARRRLDGGVEFSRPKTFEKEAGVAVDRDAGLTEIVHVGRTAPPHPSASAQAIHELLVGNARVRRETDVYRALAALLQRSAGGAGYARPVAAVVICADGLADAELEFFRLLRAARPAVQVLAYSAIESDIAVERALQAGAPACATPQHIRDLLNAGTIHRENLPAAQSAAEQRQEVPTPVVDVAVAPSRLATAVKPGAMDVTANETGANEFIEDEVIAESFDDETAEFDDAPADEEAVEPDADEAARVPWLKYNDRPVRMGPGMRIPPSAPPRVGFENGAGSADQHGGTPVTPPPAPRPAGPSPLLSAEELRALLDDDVSALAPREEGPAQGEQRLQGR